MSRSNIRNEILITPNDATDFDDVSKRIHDRENDRESSADSKRVKGQAAWLQYRGKRQTRVGDNYQVNLLPKPSE